MIFRYMLKFRLFISQYSPKLTAPSHKRKASPHCGFPRLSVGHTHALTLTLTLYTSKRQKHEPYRTARDLLFI